MPSSATEIPSSQLTGNRKAFQVADKAYDFNGILVVLSQNTNEDLKGIPLDKYKSTLVYNSQKISTVQSANIETYSNIRFIILNLDKTISGENFSEYLFFSDTETNKPIIVGIISYDKATQQSKAQTLLKTILTNLKIDQ
jgi:hypothetical protein